MRSLVHGRSGGAPEIVVVPGLGALGYLMPAVRACAGWTRVQPLDLPGFGHPTTARLPATLDAVAGALSAWLAVVPDAPVVLVGHSTGAQSALRAALDHPAAVRLLVLAGATFPPHLRRLPPLAAAVAATLPREQLGEVPAVLPYYRRGARRLPELLTSALADRPEQVVTGLTPPLLVLRGEHDHLCPRPWAAELADRAPSGRLQVLPGGHNSPWTHPEATSQALRAAVGASA